MPHNEFSILKEDQNDENRVLISVLHKYKEICQQYNMQTDYQLGAIMHFDTKNITHLYTKVNRVYKPEENKYSIHYKRLCKSN